MAIDVINIGTTPKDGTGDALRNSFDKINNNFDFLNKKTGHASYTDNGYTLGSPFVLSANTDTVLPNRSSTIYDEQLPEDVKCFYYAVELDISSITGTFAEGETITGGTSGATADIYQDNTGNLFLNNYTGTFSVSETITGGTSGATATVDVIGNGKITGRDGDGLDLMIYFKVSPTNTSQWLDVWIDIGGAVGELYRDTVSFPKGVGVERGVLYSLPSAYTRNTWEANGGTIYVRSGHDLDIYLLNFNFDRTHKGR